MLRKWWARFKFGHCRGISCYYGQDADNANVVFQPMLEYRHAKLKFCPGWFEGDAASREEDVVHEFCEILVGQFREFCRDSLYRLLDSSNESDPAKDIIMEEFRRLAEGMVEDISATILKMEGSRQC